MLLGEGHVFRDGDTACRVGEGDGLCRDGEGVRDREGPGEDFLVDVGDRIGEGDAFRRAGGWPEDDCKVVSCLVTTSRPRLSSREEPVVVGVAVAAEFGFLTLLLL